MYCETEAETLTMIREIFEEEPGQKSACKNGTRSFNDLKSMEDNDLTRLID